MQDTDTSIPVLLIIKKLSDILAIDIRCDNLSAPTNGEIMSCSSGRVGVGYEGDTCSFTCNTGYELTGSDTRTCQSNGNWNGTDVTCRRGMGLYIQCCFPYFTVMF